MALKCGMTQSWTRVIQLMAPTLALVRRIMRNWNELAFCCTAIDISRYWNVIRWLHTFLARWTFTPVKKEYTKLKSHKKRNIENFGLIGWLVLEGSEHCISNYLFFEKGILHVAEMKWKIGNLFTKYIYLLKDKITAYNFRALVKNLWHPVYATRWNHQTIVYRHSGVKKQV